MITDILKKIQSVFANKKTEPTPSDVAQLCKSNKKEDYDTFWSNEELIKAYMEPARIEAHNLLVEFVMAKNIKGRIIDIGFGSADFIKLLLERPSSSDLKVYGLDYSEAAVSRAQKIIPEGTFLTGDVYDLPFEENYFDYVCCIQTLEHLKNPEKVVAEFDRICVPDGLILISIPNGDLDTYEGHVNFWNDTDIRTFLGAREIVDFVHYNDNRAFLIACKPLKKEC
jgi:ubiquinone/menaquinone biosynthesis C-methylase UbiE